MVDKKKAKVISIGDLPKPKNSEKLKSGRKKRRTLKDKNKHLRYKTENRRVKNKARKIARRIRNYKSYSGFLNGLESELKEKVLSYLNN